MSGIVRAVHQSFTKLGDTPLARLDLFESLPSRRFGCRASTTNSTTKSRSTSLYNAGASSRGGCRALQLYSAPERSTALQLYSALHSTTSTSPLCAAREQKEQQQQPKQWPGPLSMPCPAPSSPQLQSATSTQPSLMVPPPRLSRESARLVMALEGVVCV